MAKKIFFILIFLILGNLSFSQSTTRFEDREKDYVILANDILEVTVYGEPDLSTTVRVAQDGTISFPLLGNIQVSGFTVRNLENKLTELLGEDYLVNPQVKVFVKQYANISILGEVRSPGSYQMKEGLTLTEAIALAGGFTVIADSSRIKVIRTVNNKKEAEVVDLDRSMKENLSDKEIRSNDVIVVEPYGQFAILGQVLKPGNYFLKKNLTVVDAIGLAGGFTPTAAQNGVRVVREEDGKKAVIRVPVGEIMSSGDRSKDVTLQEGDSVVVPESFF